ncbi:hypothetical protein IAE22_31505 [Bacillus sp. S34]|nr:hypothetical protein [Bacillus sp. S34]
MVVRLVRIGEVPAGLPTLLLRVVDVLDATGAEDPVGVLGDVLKNEVDFATAVQRGVMVEPPYGTPDFR